MNTKSRFLVVIPTYNVQDYIIQIVHDLQTLDLDLDLLVIDYGSNDRTKILLTNNQVPHLTLPIKTSYYKALQLGLEYGHKHHYNGVIEYDSRGCFEAKDVQKIVGIFMEKKVDFVLSTRYSKHGQSLEKDRFKIFMLRLIIKFITGENVSDPMLRFRIYGSQALEFFALNNESEPATDTIAQLIRNRLTFSEVAIRQEANEVLDHYTKENRLTSWWETTYFAFSILLVQPFKKKVVNKHDSI